MTTFPDVLRAVLKRAGLSQDQLSTKTGISRKHINALCLGKQDPSLTMALRIKQVVRINLNAITLKGSDHA